VEKLTAKVIQSFPRRLDRKSVSKDQVTRLVQKLVDSLTSRSRRASVEASRQRSDHGASPRSHGTARGAEGEAAGPALDAGADLNKLSDEEIRAAKAAMDVQFMQNRVAADDPRFQYDVQKEFHPTEENDWDDGSSDCPDSAGSDNFEWDAL